MERGRRNERMTAVPSRRPDRRVVGSHHRVRQIMDISTPEQVSPVPAQTTPPEPAPIAPNRHRSTSSAKPALPRTARSFVLRRQIREGATQQKKKIRRLHHEHTLSIILITIVLVALGVVAWSFRELLPVPRFFNKAKPATSVQPPAASSGTSSLDETAVTTADVQGYIVPADYPKVLRIPKLDLESRIRRVGTSLNGEPISPTNIYDAGWFDGSSKPDTLGAVLLNGHISGPTKPGLFANLEDLVAGDVIEIQLGDSRVIRYVVSKTQRYQTASLDMNAAINAIDPTKKGLNLVTAANKYSSLPGQATYRIIIFALQQ